MSGTDRAQLALVLAFLLASSHITLVSSSLRVNRKTRSRRSSSADPSGDSSDDSSADSVVYTSSSSLERASLVKSRPRQQPFFPFKRGLTASPFDPKGPEGNRKQTTKCGDARVLNLQNNWYTNWSPIPLECPIPFAREFVPMIWSCWNLNCTNTLPANYRELWKEAGVKFLMAFNEPSLPKQANLSPEEAAFYWRQVDEIAQSFDPPLRLVGPAMKGWTSKGGSDWLDDFLALLEPELRNRIEFLCQHDYSGSVRRIKKRADAAYRNYGRKIWLKEFAVGRRSKIQRGQKMATRKQQNAFMKEILPMLDSSDSIYRYAWYSMRNGNDRATYTIDGSFKSNIAHVTNSNLLPKANSSMDRWEWSSWPTSTGRIYSPQKFDERNKQQIHLSS